VARRCVRSRNLENEEAKARYRAVENTTTMGCNARKTNKQRVLIIIYINSAIYPYPKRTGSHRQMAVLNKYASRWKRNVSTATATVAYLVDRRHIWRAAITEDNFFIYTVWRSFMYLSRLLGTSRNREHIL
jgi:hypothetical protein